MGTPTEELHPTTRKVQNNTRLINLNYNVLLLVLKVGSNYGDEVENKTSKAYKQKSRNSL